MKTYIIESIHGTPVPFRVEAPDEETALERVSKYMGVSLYKVVGIEDHKREECY